MKRTDATLRSQRVRERAYKIRSQYIAERGGVCELCETPYPPECFDFHHPDPSKKETDLRVDAWRSVKGQDKARAEADTCHLLCSNCHRMEHLSLKQGRSLLEIKRHNDESNH